MCLGAGGVNTERMFVLVTAMAHGTESAHSSVHYDPVLSGIEAKTMRLREIRDEHKNDENLKHTSRPVSALARLLGHSASPDRLGKCKAQFPSSQGARYCASGRYSRPRRAANHYSVEQPWHRYQLLDGFPMTEYPISASAKGRYSLQIRTRRGLMEKASSAARPVSGTMNGRHEQERRCRPNPRMELMFVGCISGRMLFLPPVRETLHFTTCNRAADFMTMSPVASLF
ncbi:hypothetical protein V8F06_001192 [Rhypophila decipiens]